MSCLISFPIIDCWNQNKKKYGSVNFIIWLYRDNRYMYVNKYLTPVHYKRKIKTLITYSRLYHYQSTIYPVFLLYSMNLSFYGKDWNKWVPFIMTVLNRETWLSQVLYIYDIVLYILIYFLYVPFLETQKCSSDNQRIWQI